MAFKHLYFSGSGPTLTEACCLGQRYEADRPFSPYAMESWVIRFSPGTTAKYTVHPVFGVNRWFTMLWRSPAGTIYVSDTNECVQRTSNLDDASAWQVDPLPATMRGVWGIDDASVFAWGESNQGFAMFRWDGSRWLDMPCPGEVVRIHGLRPDDLYAVGAHGLLAHWDGSQWTAIPVETRETLTGVFVAGPDEYYASGEQGTVLSGSTFGARQLLRWKDGPIWDVAKAFGHLWLAGDASGLLRLTGTGDEPEPFKPKIKALSFDARRNLVITCSDVIAETADGASFMGSGRGVLEQQTANSKPLWQI